jgi:Peptidase M15
MPKGRVRLQPAIVLGALTIVAVARPAEPPATVAAGFAVKYRNVISPDRVRTLTALPGETVTLEVVVRDPGSGYVARPAAGRVVPLGTGRWAWTAPPAPGLYPIQVVAPDGRDSVTLQAFVVVPYDRLRGEFLNGYRIGRYPEKPLRGLAGDGPPLGFIEVTPDNEDVLVSPHFRLKQFLCKQPAGSRRYVVLNERLLVALEYVLERVNDAGYRATTFHVMSGYRTPAYNRSLGNVRYSQHQWGAAADIFIDANGDGRMDDLNGDGRSDIRDAEVLYRLIDRAAARPEAQGLIGGLGKYPSTPAHGPFVHIDVRDRKARW